MDLPHIGLREFRARLAHYVLETTTPVAITRHNATVGFFLPAHPARTSADRAALEAAAAQFAALLAASGLTEDALLADFQAWRAAHPLCP